MEFRLLGPLEVVDGGAPLPIPARKQRALLAVLLLSANRTVARERLVDDLWGEEAPESARKMVQIYVSQLRKALPNARLHTRPPGYLLEVADDELDLARFERLVADGRAALANGSPHDGAGRLREALGLWRGPALAEFSEPFAPHEAARLEELHVAAFEWRIEADLALGRHADVVAELEALIGRYPLRERLRSQQMLALYRAGRQAEALASYQAFRRALSDELGIDPSASLKELERRMLRQDAELEHRAPVGATLDPLQGMPLAEAGSTPLAAPRPKATPRAPELVGRQPELEALRTFVDEFPQALVLTGSPGIGKTSLWAAGVEHAREQGLRVLAARPSDAEAQHAFGALIDLLDTVASSELGELPVPQLNALEVALLRSGPTGPAPEGPAIAVGFLAALRALASRTPVVVAVDDIQWLDPPSAEVLAFAARRLEGLDVGFLLTARPGSPHALELALEAWGLRRLEAAPLSVGAIRHLLSERVGLDPGRHLLRRITEATLGNPLFALEMGRTLVERGRPAAGEQLPLPASVEELLGSRVERLPVHVQRLLLAASLTADLRRAHVAAIASVDARDDAVDAGVLAVEGARVRPTHPLLAAAATNRSRARERRQLHSALAEAVSDEERRALHLALATELPDDELAARVAAAARRASVRGAAQEAAMLAEHALRLTAAGSAERVDRLLELGSYLVVAGQKRRVTQLLAPTLETLPPGAPRARANLILVDGVIESNEDIWRHLERALVESGDDVALRAPVLARMAENEAAVRVTRIHDAEQWAVEAAAAAQRANPGEERRALYALAWARSLAGGAIDDVCSRYRTLSEGAPYISQSPERVAGQRLVWRGEVAEARVVLTELLLEAEERGEPSSYALQRLHLCEVELRAGDWDEAARLLDEWSESQERELLHWPMYERCRALLAAGRGLVDEARRWAADAISRADAGGVRWDLFEASRALAIAELLAR